MLHPSIRRSLRKWVNGLCNVDVRSIGLKAHSHALLTCMHASRGRPSFGIAWAWVGGWPSLYLRLEQISCIDRSLAILFFLLCFNFFLFFFFLISSPLWRNHRDRVILMVWEWHLWLVQPQTQLHTWDMSPWPGLHSHMCVCVCDP